MVYNDFLNYSYLIFNNYLKNNECIGIPTETVYGLAGNAYSDSACKKIYKLKKRPKNKSILIANEVWIVFGRDDKILPINYISIILESN